MVLSKGIGRPLISTAITDLGFFLRPWQDTLTQLAAARVPPPYSVQYQAGEGDQQRQRVSAIGTKRQLLGRLIYDIHGVSQGDGHGTVGDEVQMDEVTTCGLVLSY